jgi:phosphoribosylformylglycinamidine synthase subunit PurQ / glutaminase
MKPHIVIVQFPGVNCEYETARAVEKAGMEATIVRWNEPPEHLAADGFVLPGGFSYEDRVRAGAIAAADGVIEVLREEARRGKPIVGICNGAQILVESGMVPGLRQDAIDLALAPNKGTGRDGYYADWVFVKAPSDPARSAITCCLEPDEVLPIPVAHSQGRFISGRPEVFEQLDLGGQITFKYCRHDGTAPRGFPEDPNGSERCAAAISNPSGNVIAMMPHPERGSWLRQVPGEVRSVWAERRLSAVGSRRTLEEDGPCARMFQSLRRYIEENL